MLASLLTAARSSGLPADRGPYVAVVGPPGSAAQRSSHARDAVRSRGPDAVRSVEERAVEKTVVDRAHREAAVVPCLQDAAFLVDEEGALAGDLMVDWPRIAAPQRLARIGRWEDRARGAADPGRPILGDPRDIAATLGVELIVGQEHLEPVSVQHDRVLAEEVDEDVPEVRQEGRRQTVGTEVRSGPDGVVDPEQSGSRQLAEEAVLADAVGVGVDRTGGCELRLRGSDLAKGRNGRSLVRGDEVPRLLRRQDREENRADAQGERELGQREPGLLLARHVRSSFLSPTTGRYRPPRPRT